MKKGTSMTEKQSVEAFARARTWRAYIEEHGAVSGCNHVVACAQALYQHERADAYEMLVRSLLLEPLVLRDTPYWAPWADGDKELTDIMRGVDTDLLPEHTFNGLHTRTRMHEHYVMRRVLEEFSRACDNAGWVDVWLSRAVDFFLYEDNSGRRYACTTCAQFALDSIHTDAARAEALNRAIESFRGRFRDDHTCFALALWCMTRLPRTTERDAALAQLCRVHPHSVAEYLKRPAHQSVLQRLVALGVAEPTMLEAAV